MFIAQKPCSFAGRKFKIGETIPEGLVHEKAIPRLKKGGILAVVGEGLLLPSTTTLEEPRMVDVPILADEGEAIMDMTVEDLQAGVRAVQLSDDDLLKEIETIESGDVLIFIDVIRGNSVNEAIHEAAKARAASLEPAPIPDTEAELMKLTRQELVDIATRLGMMVEDKHTKPVLTEYILQAQAGSDE